MKWAWAEGCGCRHARRQFAWAPAAPCSHRCCNLPVVLQAVCAPDRAAPGCIQQLTGPGAASVGAGGPFTGASLTCAHHQCMALLLGFLFCCQPSFAMFTPILLLRSCCYRLVAPAVQDARSSPTGASILCPFGHIAAVTVNSSDNGMHSRTQPGGFGRASARAMLLDLRRC